DVGAQIGIIDCAGIVWIEPNLDHRNSLLVGAIFGDHKVGQDVDDKMRAIRAAHFLGVIPGQPAAIPDPAPERSPVIYSASLVMLLMRAPLAGRLVKFLDRI